MNCLVLSILFMQRMVFYCGLALLSTKAWSSSGQPIETVIQQWEKTLTAHIGVTVLLSDHNHVLWQYKSKERVPLNSTFKTIACAKLLNDADNDLLALDDKVRITQSMLVTYSPVMEQQVGKRVTLQQACEATMLTSDNTAANIVVKAVGGPSAITAFLRDLGDTTTRLDRLEPALNSAIPGDLKDTTTPMAMAHTLSQLLFGVTLSTRRQTQLLTWMIQNQVTGNLLRSVQPAHWTLADRSGAGGFGSRSITAAAWSDAQAPILISIYVTQSQGTFEQRNEAIAKIGQAIFNQLEQTDLEQSVYRFGGHPMLKTAKHKE